MDNSSMRRRSYDGKNLSLDRVREALNYNPETGVFTWRIRVGKKVRVGSVAGSKTSKGGYVLINLDRNVALAHRLVWFYVYGEWPSEQVDHINGDRADNRLSNLRLANQSQNSCNCRLRKTNTSGYRGVSWSKEKRKWVSRIVKDHKQHVLGYFKSKDEAYYAYLQAADRLHGEYSRA